MKYPLNFFRDEPNGLVLWITRVGVDAYGNKAVWVARGDHAGELRHNRKIQLSNIPAWGRMELPAGTDLVSNQKLIAALTSYYQRYCLPNRQAKQGGGIRI